MGSNGAEELQELYQHASKWTLAQDTSIVEYLERFSKRIIARTESTNKNLQATSHDAQNCRIRLQSCINSFNMLSNLQFMESRVREEELSAKISEKVPIEDPSNPQETPENRKWRELKETVGLTKSVLDNAFDVVEVNVDDSDDEDVTPTKRTFRDAKDPYLRRPLPYLIGSEEFNRDRYIGLKLKSDDQPDESPDDFLNLKPNLDDILVPSPSTRSRTSTLIPLGQESPNFGGSQNSLNKPVVPSEVFTSVPKVLHKPSVVISSSESEDEKDIFSSKSVLPSNIPKSALSSSTDVSDVVPRTRSASQNSSNSSTAQKQPTSIFADEDEENDLFSPAKLKPPVTTRSNKLTGKSNTGEESQTVKPVIPARPVVEARSKASAKPSLFDDDDDEDINAGFFVPSKPSLVSTPKGMMSELAKKIGAPVPNRSALPDLNPTAVESPKVIDEKQTERPAPAETPNVITKPEKKSTLFDDEDDDLFTTALKPPSRASKPQAPVRTSLPWQNEPKTETISKSSISPFDGVPNDSTTLPKSRSGTTNGLPEVQKSVLPEKTPLLAKSKTSIFEDDDDDDVFAISSKSRKTSTLQSVVLPAQAPAADLKPPTVYGKVSLFDDEDDDLFSVSKNSKSTATSKAVDSTTGSKSSSLKEISMPRTYHLAEEPEAISAPPVSEALSDQKLPKPTDKSNVDFNIDQSASSLTKKFLGDDENDLFSTRKIKDSAVEKLTAIPREIKSEQPFVETKSKIVSSNSVEVHDADVFIQNSNGSGFVSEVTVPPKTAPAALYGPMKWKLPGLAEVNESGSPSATLIENPEEVSVLPIESSANEVSAAAHLPTSLSKAPPAPVPRRRVSPKTESMSTPIVSSDELKNMDSNEIGVKMILRVDAPTEDSFVVSAVEKEAESKQKIPQFIPEMTLDTDKVSDREPEKSRPPVASRRQPAKRAQVSLVSGSDLSNEISDEIRITAPVGSHDPISHPQSPSKEPKPEESRELEDFSVKPTLEEQNQRMEIKKEENTAAFVFSGNFSELGGPEMRPPGFLDTVVPTSLEPDSFLDRQPVANLQQEQSLFAPQEPPFMSSKSSSLSGSQTSLKKRGGSIFEENDSDEDLFGKSHMKVPLTISKKEPVTPLVRTTLFGDANSENTKKPIVTAFVDPLKIPPEIPDDTFITKSSSSTSKPSKSKISGKSTLFIESDSDDDLFVVPVPGTVVKPEKSANAVGKEQKSTKITKPVLFEDESDEDDFFRK